MEEEGKQVIRLIPESRDDVLRQDMHLAIPPLTMSPVTLQSPLVNGVAGSVEHRHLGQLEAISLLQR